MNNTETKKSKVKSVQGNGTWNSPNGLFYKWEVEFENGDVGGAMTKKTPQDRFVVGKETSYTIEDRNGFKVVKYVDEKPFNKETKDTGTITALSCISSACINLQQSPQAGDVDKILFMAEKFFQYAKSKSTP